MLERSHASYKQALKIETGERKSLWQKYVKNAILNYNTIYHACVGCEPSCVIHGGSPYDVLGLKLANCPQQAPIPTTQIAQDVLEQADRIYQDVL